MSDFDNNVAAPLDLSELGVYNNTTPEPVVVKHRAFEATTSIGMYF
jgi:hypothetical protein